MPGYLCGHGETCEVCMLGGTGDLSRENARLRRQIEDLEADFRGACASRNALTRELERLREKNDALLAENSALKERLVPTPQNFAEAMARFQELQKNVHDEIAQMKKDMGGNRGGR